eukprot:gene760-1026_t
MTGKRGLVMGVANNRSIAWGIARAVATAGAEVALTYQGDALKKRVEPLMIRPLPSRPTKLRLASQRLLTMTWVWPS